MSEEIKEATARLTDVANRAYGADLDPGETICEVYAFTDDEDDQFFADLSEALALITSLTADVARLEAAAEGSVPVGGALSLLAEKDAKIEALTSERDAARAEVERLRGAVGALVYAFAPWKAQTVKQREAIELGCGVLGDDTPAEEGERG